jgi:hypothetical protein
MVETGRGGLVHLEDCSADQRSRQPARALSSFGRARSRTTRRVARKQIDRAMSEALCGDVIATRRCSAANFAASRLRCLQGRARPPRVAPEATFVSGLRKGPPAA